MTSSIVSSQNPLVKHLLKLRTDGTYRNNHQRVLLEGVKPIQEVTSHITQVFYTPEYASIALNLPGEKWEISNPILHKISGMKSPEGIVAEVRMPPFVPLLESKALLAFDGVSDPGNLGTMLRTALALGWDTVYFLPGSCDPFNDKALRAARGAHFKLSLTKGTAEELQIWVKKKEKVQSLVANIQGQPPESFVASPHRMLVMGNEAHGPSLQLRAFCQSVSIPMSGDMESLNVAIAGGILLYLLKPEFV